MTSAFRVLVLLLSIPLLCGQVLCGEELSTALRGAAGDGRPVLLLVRNPRNVATLDAAHWLSDAPQMAGILNGVHLATAWNDEDSLKGFPQFRDGGLCLLNAQGRTIASIPIPDLREQLKARIEQALADPEPLDDLVARAEGGAAGDETLGRAWQRLVDAGQTERAVQLLGRPENRALAQRLSMEVDLPLRQRLLQLRGALGSVQGAGEESGRALMREMLAERMDEQTALRCVRLLAEAVVRWGGEDEFKLLQKKIDRDSPRGRAAARAALRAGDVVAGRQGGNQAKDWWKLAERAAGNGESPVLLRAAVRQRWAADGKDSPLRSRWRKREVLDVVVLVNDDASFLDAIGRWSEKTHFPVLFQDDLCAPRFIAAFRPSQVVVVPPVTDGKAVAESDVLGALLGSWSKEENGAQLRQPATRDALLARLGDLSDDPQGIVVTQMGADEWPGALALAAGRFQGLEFLPGSSDVETSLIAAARAREMAGQVAERLAQWELPREGRACFVTMAGDFPLACRGSAADGRSGLQAVDDWVGRAADGGRLAFTGRLTNGRVASVYMAACSLFLQPAAAMLVDGRPVAAGGPEYDLAGAERILGARWTVTRRSGQDARAVLGPEKGTWRNAGFAFVQTASGEWVADDVFAGEPAAMVFTQPGSADDPGRLDTLCGRALLGGVFWCGGCVDDGCLETWPLPARWAGAARDGVAWGWAFRRDDGQPFGWPWRAVICGDPLFCLRDEPAKRRDVRAQDVPVVRVGERTLETSGAVGEASVEEWRKRMQEARWRGDRATAQALAAQSPAAANGPMLVMALEEQLRAGSAIEAWRCWSKAEDDARRNILAGLCARQAACALMGHALAEGGLENALSAFDAFLLTGPGLDSAACWLERLARTAKSLDRLPVFSRWVAEHAMDADLSAYQKAFQDCARQIGQEALGNGKNGH